jgi:hypothetical protein
MPPAILVVVIQEAGGSADAGMKRGNPVLERLKLDSPSSSSHSGPPPGGSRMNRDHGTSREGRRTLGLILALGATFGAAVGAVIGVGSGDIGHWMRLGVPAGISVGLAAGAVFSKPSRREPMSGAETIPWTASDDDSAPLLSRSQTRP